MWKPDARFLSSTVEAFGQQVRDLVASGAERAVPAASRALRSAGTLRLAGREDEARRVFAESGGAVDWVTRALEDFDPLSLDSAGELVATVAPSLRLVDAESHELDARAKRQSFDSPADLSLAGVAALGDGTEPAADLRNALDLRDRVETLLQGAEALLGREAPLSVEQRVSLAHFEQLVRPLLWQLVPMGHMRADAVAWMEPRYRPRFWWWSHGADVSADGLDHLAGAALVISRFPEARAAMEAMIEAQKRLDRAVLPTGPSGLRDWILRWRTDAGLLLQHAEFTVSWAEPDELLVDVPGRAESDPAPTVRREDGRAVAHEEVRGRFHFRLGDALDSNKLSLRVPLNSGAVEVSLPPREES